MAASSEVVVLVVVEVGREPCEEEGRRDWAKRDILSTSLELYIYIYIYMCVYVYKEKEKRKKRKKRKKRRNLKLQ